MNFFVRGDPLVLDLDGDGLELSAASGNTLFDYNADGIKTGTGWARPDDGFLVRDINNNGIIDSGRELFGIDTLKSNGALATQGFDALKDLDSNNDSLITGADAAFAQLKVWQDANQDGISQGSELKTLAQLGITSIGLNGTATGPQAGQILNNNLVALSAGYTRNGVTRTVGAIDLEMNNFFTEFPPEVVDEAGNPVAITEQAQALPQMNGSGMVRNLRAAASLSTGLAEALQTFAATTTRDGQLGQLDSLITKWAGTTSYTGGLLSGNTANITFTLPAGMTVAQYCNMINVLEAFNGSRFYGNQQGGPRPLGFAITSSVQGGATAYRYYVSPLGEQLTLLQRAYNALKESVYAALVVQTRLKPYLDSITLGIDETGVRFDTTATIAMVQGKAATDTLNAVADLIDLIKYAGATTRAVGWQAAQTLEGVLETNIITPAIQALLAAERIVSLGTAGTNYTVVNTAGSTVLGNAAGNTLAGSSGADVLYGLAGNDTLLAVGNGDTLDGGDGADTLVITGGGASSRDTLFIGGKGNDTVTGAYFNNTYIFNLGDGQDTITSYNGDVDSYTDILKFGAGIAASDVTSVRSGTDMVFKLAGGTDQVTVKNWFAGSFGYQIEQVKFADGTVWSRGPLTAQGLEVFGTAGNDTLAGTGGYADILHAGAGNDTLLAAGNGDTLDGGDGADTLMVTGGGASITRDTFFIGGKGNDTITGAYFNNTYIFNLGDGQDTITSYNGDVDSYTDILKFGAGIAASDVTSVRSGTDMVFKLAGGTDQVTVKNWFAGSFGYQIEQVKFADGTVWSRGPLTAQGLEVFGTAGNDTLAGTGGYADILHAGAGNDTLLAVGNGDTLDGGDGADTLMVTGGGASSRDTLFIGGKGNDTMTGAYFNNTYIFNLGDGQDTITSYNGDVDSYTDVLKFGAGIAASDVTSVRSGTDMVFKLAGGTDQVTVKNWFAGSFGYQIEQVKFADGTVWSRGPLTAQGLEVFGTAGNDTLTGTGGYADILHGGAGNDTLLANGHGDILDGGDGDDVLRAASGAEYPQGTTFIGGKGNDTLTGTYYNNIYTFNLGDGQDTVTSYNGEADVYTDVLKFGAGITSADIAPMRLGDDLVFKLTNGIDQVTVKNWFSGAGYQIEQVRFADGATWTREQVTSKMNLLAGTAGTDSLNGLADRYNMVSGLAGNDNLNGSNYADRLEGGTGNDTLSGQAGNDAYIYSLGDGRDTIVETSGNDRIVFGAGIAATQITASMMNGQVTLNVSSSDSLSFAAPVLGSYAMEQFEFADGSVKGAAWLNGLLDAGPKGTDKTLNLSEDGSYAMTAAGLGFSGADAGDSLGAVRIDSLPGEGSLQLNGIAVIATQVIGASDLAAGRLVFKPAANANGSNYASLAFSVQDQRGVFDAMPNTLVFNVAPVNDAPVLTGAKAAMDAGIEDTNYVITRAGLLAGFSDVEGSVLSVVNLSASNGSLSAFNAATGSWTWTPGANYNGTVNLNYGVSDGATATPAAQSFTLAAVNDMPTGTVTLSGIATQNKTLTAANALADADGLGTVAYQWMAGGTPIAGATGSSLTLAQDQVGKAISVKASYTDAQGTAESKTSAATAVVANVNDAPTGVISLLRNGAALTATTTIQQGDTLTSTHTLADADGLGALSYQWQRYDGSNWLAISGATTGSLTLDPSLAWRYVRLAISYTDGFGAKENVASAATALVNRVNGTVGNDTLAGTTGSDLLLGGLGDDNYIANNVGDVIGEEDYEGIDTVMSSVDHTIRPYIEFLTLVGPALNGTGNPGDNTLTGNDGNNWLMGSFGADALIGGAGDDILDGAVANDVSTVWMTIADDGTAQYYTYGGPTSTLAMTDFVAPSVGAGQSMMFQGAISESIKIYVTPGSHVDLSFLAMNAGSLYLSGKLADYGQTIDPCSGTYIFSRHLPDGLNESIAVPLASAINARLYFADGYMVLNGIADTPLVSVSPQANGGYWEFYWDPFTGGYVQNYVETYTEVLTFQPIQQDWLESAAQDWPADIPLITQGADRLIGGMGNDSYYMDETGDVVIELAGEGTDTVQAGVSHTLAANVENLTLTGNAAINGTGNNLANVLVGNSMANTLDGGAGDDILSGGMGNDIYAFAPGGGADTVQENDFTDGNTDVLQFRDGIRADQLWMRHLGNDLEISVIGTNDRATVQNWYLGNQYHVEQIKSGDGKLLTDSRVDQLVSAMAGFAPPAMGETSLSASYAAQLAPTLAASWN